jgi:8-oxo-dGTP diphosphatase
MKIVEVAVGVIKQGQQIYISRRAESLHQGGKWEFPGGKREEHETIEHALVRELQEEIGIKVLAQQPLMIIEHDYGDKRVRIDVRIVEVFEGKPNHQEGQESRWVNIANLNEFEFPAANKEIVERLQTMGNN